MDVTNLICNYLLFLDRAIWAKPYVWFMFHCDWVVLHAVVLRCGSPHAGQVKPRHVQGLHFLIIMRSRTKYAVIRGQKWTRRLNTYVTFTTWKQMSNNIDDLSHNFTIIATFYYCSRNHLSCNSIIAKKSWWKTKGAILFNKFYRLSSKCRSIFDTTRN